MFEVTATGKNENYGKEGEKRLLNDSHTMSALKHGWITDRFKWVGNVKTAEKITFPQAPMPFQKINVERTLNYLLKRHDRILKEIKQSKKVIRELKKLIKGDNK